MSLYETSIRTTSNSREPSLYEDKGSFQQLIMRLLLIPTWIGAYLVIPKHLASPLINTSNAKVQLYKEWYSIVDMFVQQKRYRSAFCFAFTRVADAYRLRRACSS